MMLPLHLQKILSTTEITIVHDNALSHRTVKRQHRRSDLGGLSATVHAPASSAWMPRTSKDWLSSSYHGPSPPGPRSRKKGLRSPACRWESIPTKSLSNGKDVPPILTRSMGSHHHQDSVITLTASVRRTTSSTTMGKLQAQPSQNRDTAPCIIRRRNSGDEKQSRSSITKILQEALQDTDDLLLDASSSHSI